MSSVFTEVFISMTILHNSIDRSQLKTPKQWKQKIMLNNLISKYIKLKMITYVNC